MEHASVIVGAEEHRLRARVKEHAPVRPHELLMLRGGHQNATVRKAAHTIVIDDEKAGPRGDRRGGRPGFPFIAGAA